MWILWRMSENKSLLRRVLPVAVVAAWWAYLQWNGYRRLRQVREAERRLLAEGVTISDEDPIPIRLAESRQSLVVSLIALVLIVLVFVGHYAGWFSGFIRR